MPSWRNGPLTSLKQAGYLEPMLPVTLPEPLPLLQAASMDSVMEALASLPAELRDETNRSIVLLRGRRHLNDPGERQPSTRLFRGHRHARLGDPDRQLSSVSEDRPTRLVAPVTG